jgi:hypothetical protein
VPAQLPKGDGQVRPVTLFQVPVQLLAQPQETCESRQVVEVGRRTGAPVAGETHEKLAKLSARRKKW